MIPTSVLVGLLLFLVASLWTTTYLMYVRVRCLRQEAERLRSKAELGEEELRRIESTLDSTELNRRR